MLMGGGGFKLGKVENVGVEGTSYYDAQFKRGIPKVPVLLESGGLGSGGCGWFESTLKVLQLIYKYLVVSCAVFNYLNCTWFKSTL